MWKMVLTVQWMCSAYFASPTCDNTPVTLTIRTFPDYVSCHAAQKDVGLQEDTYCIKQESKDND